MLEGILYRRIACSENDATLQLLPESPIYAAHFPGYPVTPGVALVQMALECMGRSLKGAKDIKFLVPVVPCAEGVQIRFQWSFPEEGKAQVQVFLPGQILCAKMSLSI